MNVLSLFDGISCGMVALQQLGISFNSYYASEIEPNAEKVSQRQYPNIIRIGDVTKLNYENGVLISEKGRFNVDNIDLLIGGSPCQGFTYAGFQDGMVTEEDIEITSLETYLRYKEQGYKFKGQSYLFWEYVRLLKQIKPEYFLLENVKMAKKWENIITNALGVQPILLNSADFSPQRRQRLYWANFKIEQPITSNSQVLQDIVRTEDNNHYHLSQKHLQGFLKSYNWTPNYLHEKSKPLLASYYKQPPHCPYIPCDKSESGYRMLSPIECERLQGLPDNYTEGISKTQRYKCLGNGWNVPTIVYILGKLKGKI